MSEQLRKLDSIYTTFQMRKLRIQEFDTKSKIIFLGRGKIQLSEIQCFLIYYCDLVSQPFKFLVILNLCTLEHCGSVQLNNIPASFLLYTPNYQRNAKIRALCKVSHIIEIQPTYFTGYMIVYGIKWQSPSFLATGTSFVEDVFHGPGEGGGLRMILKEACNLDASRVQFTVGLALP